VRKPRLLAVAILAALAFAACAKSNNTPSATSSSSSAAKPAITIGSANFTEAIVLGEIYAQGLEAKGYHVTKKLNLGAREVYYPALKSGSVDLVPEYTGNLLRYVTKDTNAGSSDTQKTYDSLKAPLAKDGVTALAMSSAQDVDEFVTNKATADQYHLTKVSDLKSVSSQMTFGGPPECQTRESCYKGLVDVYGLKFKEFKSLDASGTVTINLLKSNQIQVADLYSTDARVTSNGLVVLQDDKGLEAAQSVLPIIRTSVLDAGGDALRSDLDAITAKFTTAGLTELDKKVDTDKQDASVVAKAWLQQNGLM